MTSRESLGDAMNREGMTWEEWRNAALSDGSKSHKAAWRRGEDPTEHRLDDDPSPRSGHRDDRWS